jgi:hypothetical protein
MVVMRLLLAVVLALASGAAGCCFFGAKDGGAARHDVGRPPQASSGLGEQLYLDVALVEQPGGDAFLDREVWEAGDEQGVALETKPLLEENGLRVALVGGLLPARLQALLSSPRSCPNPRRLRAQPGQPTFVPVGPPHGLCKFTLRLDGSARPVEVPDACCLLGVVPLAEEEGRLRLRFTPHLRHGKARLRPHVARDPDGQLRWDVEPCEPVEDFDALRFELVVSPDEYVVLGTRFDQPDTLGHCYFVRGGRPRQHLLVLHPLRLPAGPTLDEAMTLAPPLALQATQAARGKP